MLVRLAWTGPPPPACKLALAGTSAYPRFAPLQKNHQARRTPDVSLRFVGFNFGHV